jgi:hypothetical protein
MSLKNNLAAKKRGTFSYAQKAKRLGMGDIGFRDALPVVPQAQDYETRLRLQFCFHLRGVRMARHVCQRFLEDAKKSGGHFR